MPQRPRRPARAAQPADDPALIAGARRARLPRDVEPELATLVATPPTGSQWWHEIKFDGYRLICRAEKGRAQLFTRRGLDWTAKFPSIAASAAQLSAMSIVLDGEAVVLDCQGVSSFQALQMALSEKASGRIIYYAFDLLYLDGYDLRGAPLSARKQLLAQQLATLPARAKIRLSEHFAVDGPLLLRECCARGLEGIVSKRADRPYTAGRGTDWLKSKCIQREEFVIGGFTEPTASRQGLGALLVGYYDRDGALHYAGRVGTGFSDHVLVDLRKRLDRLERRQPTFSNLTAREAGRGVHFVRPQLVCQVEFTNWTRDHVLRHPSFQGLRTDLPAREVVRDAPVPGGLAEEPRAPKAQRRPASESSRARRK